MDFSITKAECKIIDFLLNKKSPTASSADIPILFDDNKEMAEKALEGCLSKGFISKSGENIFLTELGVKQI